MPEPNTNHDHDWMQLAFCVCLHWRWEGETHDQLKRRRRKSSGGSEGLVTLTGAGLNQPFSHHRVKLQERLDSLFEESPDRPS